MEIKNKKVSDDVMGFVRFTDFSLATTLVCLEYQLLSVEPSKENPKRLEFIFEKSETIEKIIEGYWCGNLLVDPKKYGSINREIKSRIQPHK